MVIDISKTGFKFLKISTLCAIMIFPLLSCSIKQNDQHNFIDLSGKWKIIESSDDAAADPAYDDSNAGEIEIPGDWKDIIYKHENLSATVWLRKKIIIDKNTADELKKNLAVLSLGYIALVDKTYINGYLIGSTGTFPVPEKPLSFEFAWQKERYYRFNPSFLKSDGENVIAIKVFSHYFNGIDSAPLLHSIDYKSGKSFIKEYLPPLNNLYPVLISVFLIFFLYMILRSRGVGDFLFYAYGITFMLSVLLIIVLLIGLPQFEDNTSRFKLFFSLYVFTDFIVFLLVQKFFNYRSRFLVIVFSLLMLFTCTLITLAPSTGFLINYCFPVIYSIIIIFIIFTLKIFITSLIKDPKRFWPLLPIVLFIVITASNTHYYIITHQVYKISFIYVLRMPAILLAALVVSLFDLKNLFRENVSTTQALLNKTRELQRVKKLLTKTGMKPEPRDVIHKVIDYVDNNFNRTYDRKKLADTFGLNEDYMCSLFKKTTGTNISNYINIKRINAAKQLLNETDSKVIDIAFHVGFDNLTYFYRYFKKLTGYSPLEFKQKIRNNLVPVDIIVDIIEEDEGF